MRDQTCSVLLADSRSGSEPGTAGGLVMKKNYLRWGLAGAIAVLAVFYLVSGFFGGRTISEDDRQDSTAVIIAQRYIPPFSPIHADDVSIRNPKVYGNPHKQGGRNGYV